jgi:hypothetical protein
MNTINLIDIELYLKQVQFLGSLASPRGQHAPQVDKHWLQKTHSPTT